MLSIIHIFFLFWVLLDVGMGKKRRLPIIEVGEGPPRSRQRGKGLAAAHSRDTGTHDTGSLHVFLCNV